MDSRIRGNDSAGQEDDLGVIAEWIPAFAGMTAFGTQRGRFCANLLILGIIYGEVFSGSGVVFESLQGPV